MPRVIFWAACVIAFVMSVLPDPPQLPGLLSDKAQHALAFLLLAVLGVWAYPRVKKRHLLLGLAAFGALIEIVQATPLVNRDSDPLDWITDIAAALTVFVLIALWSYRQSRSEKR